MQLDTTFGYSFFNNFPRI